MQSALHQSYANLQSLIESRMQTLRGETHNIVIPTPEIRPK
jgi:hypothetical protein